MSERDDNMPPLAVLIAELDYARTLAQQHTQIEQAA